MLPVPEPIPTALRRVLEGVQSRAHPFGHAVWYYRKVGSTNDVASHLAGDGAADGTLVVAGMQTRGRGRHGREWFSPAGAGLYFSLVVRPDATVWAGAPGLLTLVAGVAAAEAIERVCGLDAAIKWPNDLVVEERPSPGERPRRRKLAGILAEGTIASGTLQHVVLGIGINVRDGAYPPDLRDRVTSIERETRRGVSGDELLGECLAAMAERWREVAAARPDPMLEAWRRRAPAATGAQVRITTGRGTAVGVTEGIDGDGALRVCVGDERVRVVAGEVEWL